MDAMDCAQDSGGSRVIVHLDLDCFYAQVEQRRLKIPAGQPVAVQQWGSLLAVNYTARKFGVERGDFVDDARKKCPGIHLPHVDTLGENRKPGQPFDRTHQKAILRRYRVASREIFAILGALAPIVEKASIDEAFMDVTDQAKARLAHMSVVSSDFCQDPTNRDTKVFGISLKEEEGDKPTEDGAAFSAFPLTTDERLLCIGAAIAREIREAVFKKLGYTCSTGVASNKLIAKLASPLNKPDGQMLVAPRFVAALMQTLPMRKVRGLGGKLGKQLECIYQRLDPSGKEPSEQDKTLSLEASITAGNNLQDLTAHAFLQRCGLAELAQHMGQETAAFVHEICSGSDGDDPVQEKKVQLKMLSCVKQFDQRSGCALVRVEQLEYWVHLLCEEMVLRCEDEQLENKRFPSQLTIQSTRTKAGEKPRTRKLSIAQDTTVDELFAATMKVLRISLDRLFPCASLSMHAKNFLALDSQSVASISSFFARTPAQTADPDATAQRVEEGIKQFAAAQDKRGRSGMRAASTPPRKKGKHKISAFFCLPDSIPAPPAAATASTAPPNPMDGSVSSSVGRAPDRGDGGKIEASTLRSAAWGGDGASSNNNNSNSHYCNECRRSVLETREEHADFHFALELSRAQRVEATTASRKGSGPLDAFLTGSH